MLSDAWSISYNSFTFPLYSKSTIAGKPVYDASKRAVQFISYTLTVETFITADPGAGNVEAQLIDLRKKLTTRGGTLELQATGFGHLRVNSVAFADGGIPGVDFRDVAYGPHPEIVDAKTAGSRLAWKITWKCTFNIPECQEGTAVFVGRPMEFVYTWDVQQDPHGFSTRVISGSLTIPASTLPGEKIPPDQAERFWPLIVAACPPLPSFTRESNRSLSEDRRTLKFSITDVEKPANAFVAGASEWEGSEELSTNQQSGFRTWTAGISATYQATRGQSKVALYQQFLALVGSRLRAARVPAAQAGSVLPLDFRVQDALPSQEVSFSFRWTFTTSIGAAVGASGLWQPIPGAGWPAWALSVARTVLNARGNAQLAYNATLDLIVDLCDPGMARILTSQGLPIERQLRVGGGIGGTLQATLPPPDESWLHYESHLVYEADQGVAVLRTLPPARELKTRLPKSQGQGAVLRTDPAKIKLPRGAKLDNQQSDGSYDVLPQPLAGAGANTIQQRTNPAPRVFLRGRAIRAGYSIVAPALVAAGGVAAVLQRPRFAWGIIGDAGGIPLVMAEWDSEYVLPQQGDEGLPLPPNPLFGNFGN
jgi:hypothetical protein